MPRRLLLLIGVIVLVDTMLYAALAPILPALEDEFSLSKSEAGVLVAAYPAGTLLGALPGGWLAARHGPRPVVVAGLLTMTFSGAVFALADGIVVLDLARFAQGVGGALTWTAGLAWLGMAIARDRRGEAIGFAIGAAVFGAQFGPVVGVLAEAVGRGPAFLAVAALGLVLAAGAGAEPRPVAAGDVSAPARTLLRDRAFLGAAAITFIPSFAFGVEEVLVPLRFDELGAGALGIGAAFFVAALVEAILSPFAGRFADRRGALPLVRVATLAGAVVIGVFWIPESVLLLAVLVVAFAVIASMLMTPSGKLVSLRSETLNVDQAWAFAFNNIGWSSGVALGAAVGGALGQVVGDWLAYGLCAALLLATGVAALALGSRRPDAPLGSPRDRRRARSRPRGLHRAVRPAADARPARGGRPARDRAGRRRRLLSRRARVARRARPRGGDRVPGADRGAARAEVAADAPARRGRPARRPRAGRGGRGAARADARGAGRYRRAAEHLAGRLAAERGHRFRSAPLPGFLRQVTYEATQEAVYDPVRLGAAIGGLLRTPPPIDLGHLAAPHVTVAERLAHLRTLLRRGGVSFDAAVAGADRMTVAVTLFALLELYKQGEATWVQAEPFGPIDIAPRTADMAHVHDEAAGARPWWPPHVHAAGGAA